MSLEQGGRTSAAADRGPLDRRRARAFVAVSALGVAVLGTVGAGFAQPEARAIDLGAVALLLVTPLAMVLLLPRLPGVAVLVSTAATGAFVLAAYPWGPVFVEPVVLLAAVVLCGPARRGRVIAWAGAAVLLGLILTTASLAPPVFQANWGGPQGRPGPWGPHGLRGDRVAPLTVGLSPAGVVAGTAWTVVALLGAGAVRDRVARRAAARAAARETAAERERTAVTAERLRIARELHDVLAHSLSGINVQAGVGLHLLDRDQEQARSALTSIRDTSRDALAEVRELLGIVRGGADAPPPPGTRAAGTPPRDPAPLAPAWDLSGLERLASRSRAEGLTVTLDVDAPGLPDPVAGAVHRVVQEALTNVRRHASGATRVAVSVTRHPSAYVAVVSDDGHGAPDRGTGGYGLRGMRERVEALGGTLDAGPDDVGWLVRASFPRHDRPRGASA